MRRGLGIAETTRREYPSCGMFGSSLLLMCPRKARPRYCLVVLQRDRAPGLSPERVIVQCKRYRKPVGVATVRELLGTLLREGADSGILVTTSSFTSGALKESKGQRIDMVDGAILKKWLSSEAVQEHGKADRWSSTDESISRSES